ncbi:ferric reductase-like transmembrane domain-containing protein [Candidatus Micrarchaeota archaeon]|nr:ferric reductase-like transmembrane domain-containing protein [Candidatus Micrarchaeota archaeon]MBU2475845.1 ferric reductase-like transmembrane domain-containing protein [Candidatus Micrarchaeota archaeon]
MPSALKTQKKEGIKIKDLKAHVFAAIILLAVIAIYFLSDSSKGISKFTLITRIFAYAGAVLLSCSFLLGTVKAFNPSLAKYLKYRKTIGLWGAFLIIIHFVLSMQYNYNWNFGAFLNFQNPFGFAFTMAIIAFIIFLAMTLTSNPESMKKLGLRKWKCLHRIGYIALFLGIMHALYIPSSVFYSTKHGMFLVALIILVLLLKAGSIIKDIKKYPVC